MPAKQFQISFSQAPRFETKSMESSPISQFSGSTPIQKNLKIQDVIQMYQSKKRGVFKSTFKNIKNSIELSPEYGQGLMQIMDQFNNQIKNQNITPGPAEYNPSFSVVQRRVQSQAIQPINNFRSQSNGRLQNQEQVQILVENRTPKIGLLPKIENDRLNALKMNLMRRQPRNGTLRKAKIAKNIFDQARTDEFDPSPENSSIELFVLRQKFLGPSEVPPPGHYYDSEKFSSFQLKKTSSVNIHFDSTEQRVMTFGNAATTLGDDDEDDDNDADANDNEQQQQSQERIRRSNFSQMSQEENGTQESQLLQQGNTTVQSSILSQNKSKQNYFHSSTRNKSYQTQYSQSQTQKPSFFGKSDRSSFLDIQKNQYPGPGAYTADLDEKIKKLQEQRNKPDIYFKPSFGSGCKRFLSLKTLQS